MLGMRCDGVERAVGPYVLRLVDVELDWPLGASLAGDDRLDLEIFPREDFEIVERAGDHGTDDHRVDRFLLVIFELEQLMKPDRIFVAGPPRVGRDAPARLDLALVNQCEDEVRIAGVDGKKHGSALATVTACCKEAPATG